MNAMLDDTQRLISIPSVSSNRPLCHQALDWCIEQVPAGFHRHDFEHEGFRSVVFSTRPGRRSGLVLNAHLDVVPGHPGLFSPQLRDGRLYGRGAYDMKAAAAVYLQLLRDLAAVPEGYRPDLQVQLVTDEEIGGHRGAERLVPEGFTGDFIVAGEPTDFRVCYAAKGVYWVKIHLGGKPGHAAMPWQTQNPLVAAQQGLARLLEIYPTPTEPVWRTTATPTGMRADSSHNRVPDEVMLQIDMRRVPEQTPAELHADLERCFPGAHIEVVQDSYAAHTNPEHPGCQRLAEVQERVDGQRPEFYREHFASDVRYWTHAGFPAVCWGPSGAHMHADNEYLEVDSLARYHRLVSELCSLFRS